MKKIMFNDRYGLSEAVLSGRKTMTRRIVKLTEIDTYLVENMDCEINEHGSPYKVGEIVAVAQSYKDVGIDTKNIIQIPIKGSKMKGVLHCEALYSAGWNNKMFVSADEMPHQIRITNVRVERLQDISDEDCIKEGIVKWTKDRELFKYDLSDHYEMFAWSDKPRSPREAFAALIDKISGKGTWESNPYVFAYDFKLVK